MMRTKLRAKRTERGFSPEELAEKMGITRSAYYRIEKGETSWPEGYIIRASQALECSPNDIMDDALEMVQHNHGPQHNHDHSTGCMQVHHQYLHTNEDSLKAMMEQMQETHTAILSLMREWPQMIQQIAAMILKKD